MTIDHLLDNISPLPETSKMSLKANMVEVTFPKGHILLRAGKIEQHIYLLKKGILRAYSSQDDQEVTFWFGKEGAVVISMNSYVQDQKGYENIELLEECELYEINNARLRELFSEDIHIANWGRKMVEKELIRTEERLISMQFKNASERYKELITYDTDLLQRVQLSHIASYLGITQVSLSRIRAEVK